MHLYTRQTARKSMGLSLAGIFCDKFQLCYTGDKGLLDTMNHKFTHASSNLFNIIKEMTLHKIMCQSLLSHLVFFVTRSNYRFLGNNNSETEAEQKSELAQVVYSKIHTRTTQICFAISAHTWHPTARSETTHELKIAYLYQHFCGC